MEAVTGGVAGCLVAYYGLALYFGPEFPKFGFPQLPGYTWLTREPNKKADDPGKNPATAKPVPATPNNNNGR
jgi:hypothetical protein